MSDMPTPTSPSRIEAEFPWLKMATADEQRFVDEALRYFEDPGTVHHALAFLGRPIEALSEKLPAPAKKIIEKSTDHALNLALQSALKLERSPKLPHRPLAAAIGGIGGFFGWAGLAADLPLTTVLILRGIADQASRHGFDLGARETQLECLSVFGMGARDSKSDDAMNSSYFASRAAITKVLADSSALALQRMIAQIAVRFKMRVSQKVLAEAIPLAGAVGGAGINYLFMDFFIKTADYHFGIRAMERKYNSAGTVTE